jgi:hypothetical protein
MMQAARISETSVDNYFTRQYIPEDKSELHTRRRENLKSHNASSLRLDLANVLSGYTVVFDSNLLLTLFLTLNVFFALRKYHTLRNPVAAHAESLHLFSVPRA